MTPKVKISSERVKALRELVSCPGMPVFILRNKDIDIVCPPDIIEEKYHDKLEAIQQKFYDEAPENAVEPPKIVLTSPKNWPDITFALKISKSSMFSLFEHEHQKIAGDLIKILIKTASVDELLAFGVYCRERLNAYLFTYCWTCALIHREDTRNIQIPSVTECLPAKFFAKATMNDSRRLIYMNNLDQPIVKMDSLNPVTNVNNEMRMAYFREDVAINQHHWHWHIIYPFTGPMEVVNKDRRGELFYYMHNQVLHRYNNDRICLGINPVQPLKMSRFANVEHGYFPKLDTTLGSRYICGRPDNTKFDDVLMEGYSITVDQVERWIERIRSSISQGYVVLPNEERMKLEVDTGIDVLTNLLEASILSVNRNYYGTVHNNGHVLLAAIHDPNKANKEEFGVMGDTTTAMRDIVFYQWHTVIDLVCREYKLTLPVYTKEDLSCDNVRVDSVQILKDNTETDALETFWEWDDINCSRGLNFKSSTPVYIRFKHLNHDEWEFRINVTNSLSVATQVSVRIWLVPVSDYTRKDIKLYLSQELAIEMDRFAVTVDPGSQTIVRKSEDSTCTIPFERHFPNRAGEGTPDLPTSDTAFCSCGWPHYMHLPIGSMDGVPFDVVVMLTPFEKDRVDSDDVGEDGSNYCGLRNKKYPDRRAMGFPFDRAFDSKYIYLSDFVNAFPNIEWTRIKIYHKNEERPGKYLWGELIPEEAHGTSADPESNPGKGKTTRPGTSQSSSKPTSNTKSPSEKGTSKVDKDKKQH